MMTPGSDVLQFVDSISASPTVLLNLNNGSPIYIAKDGWSAPPPRLKRAVSSSVSRDGSTVSQSSYEDRELVITLGLDTVTRDQAAEAIQALARLLNSDGQWLKYQASTIAPVFFRTKRAEIDGLDEFNGQADGFREVTIRIPAEPFAYGLPVTGTTTINNDPTAGTNPMSFVFPAIQGDVVTPLVLADSSGAVDGCMLSTAASPSAPSTPKFTQTFGFMTTQAGWTYAASQTDSDAIGGTAGRFTKSSGSLTYLGVMPLSTIPLGEWRVLVRVKSDTDFTIAGSADPNATAFWAPRPVASSSSYRYVDLGVARLPISSPNPTLPGITTLSPTSESIFFRLATASGTAVIWVDGILLVPAGLDDAAVSTLLIGAGNSAAHGAYPVNFDSNADAFWIGSTTEYVPVAFAGAMPRVLPAQKNVLTLVRSGVVYSDNKAASTTLNYLYYPRYLYIRPATT